MGKIYFWIFAVLFLAAQSSSRRLVVRRLVGRSETFLKKWPLEYQMVTETYLYYNLCASCDSSDSSDSSDISDSSNSSDQKTCVKKNILYQKLVLLLKKKSPKKLFSQKT